MRAQLSGFQLVERALADVADLERGGLLAFGRDGVRSAIQRQQVGLPPPQVIDGRVVGDLEDPGGELVPARNRSR
jgi:hypothetical protein